jgi:hypothetical protein
MNYLSTIGNKNTGKKAKRQMKAKCKLVINNRTEQMKHKCTQQHGEYCTITNTTRAKFRCSSRRFMSSCLNHRLLVTDVLCRVYVDFILISIKTRSSASFRISFRFCRLMCSTTGCSRAGVMFGCSHTAPYMISTVPDSSTLQA